MRQVCGLDVHKDSVFVCILNEDGVVFQEKFGVLTTELEQMLGVMQAHDVSEVCMESTSIYWMPVWRVLEPYFELKLVNPFFIKQLPGKKSDVKDAEWIATCLLKAIYPRMIKKHGRDTVVGSLTGVSVHPMLANWPRRGRDMAGSDAC